jgi:zinc-ribbon domain
LRRAEFAKRAATAKPVKWRYDSDGTTAQSAAIDVKTFHCSACQALVFFENTRCLNCGRSLAFAADRMSMVTLNPGNDGVWLPVNNAPQNKR